MAAIIEGFEVDFTWLLHPVMQDRAFKSNTIYPFMCIVFALCRLVRVHVWHIHVLKTRSCIVDIGFIFDKDNKLAPHKGPRSEVQPLGENLVAMVEQAQEANPATFEPLTPLWSSVSWVVALL